jgi:hypothetical protein
MNKKPVKKSDLNKLKKDILKQDRKEDDKKYVTKQSMKGKCKK